MGWTKLGHGMLRLIMVVALLVTGCTATNDTETSEAGGTGLSTTIVSSTTTAPVTSPPATTVPAVAASTSTTSLTTAATTTSTTLPAVAGLDAGLFCRDLTAMGYDYASAVTYWVREGSPDRMDADGNGIPCETVYAGTDVLVFWGDPLPTTTVVTVWYEPDDPWSEPLGRYPIPVYSDADGHGSGCAPGTDSLPDGIWFGYVTARSADRLDFDLACVWTGEAAARKAEEAGKEDFFGYWIGNVSGKIRSPRIASGAAVYHLTLDPFLTILSYDDWRQGACHGTQDLECPVWLYVNGGKVTAIVEQFFA